MPRYFIELAYEGTAYGGFQVQKNAVTIQSQVTHALEVFYKTAVELTGSSRTDAGVHARQNFFHVDMAEPIPDPERNVYNLNAILPADIVIKSLFRVADDAHCRFDALSREYQYYLYHQKDPFVRRTAFFFPYALDIDTMNQAAALLPGQRDFSAFSKKNTQVRNFECHIMESAWQRQDGLLVYRVVSNRFLRGMVKGLVGTMLRVGRGQLSVDDFRAIIDSRDCSRADFSVPSHGLFLMKVNFPSRSCR